MNPRTARPDRGRETEEQERGRLRLRPLVITSGGELLLPAVRHRAELAFGCPVVETYSASEASPLALPCRHRRQHVNSDWFLLEPVDAAGEPVAAGHRSDGVLLTNLANHVQPVIRYQLGDSVVLDAEPCPCGSALPTIRVEGRTDEILRVPRAGGGEVVLLPMAVATVVEETRGVRRYQVLQTAPAQIAVRLETVVGADRTEVRTRVRDPLAAFLRTQDAAEGVDTGELAGLRVTARPWPRRGPGLPRPAAATWRAPGTLVYAAADLSTVARVTSRVDAVAPLWTANRSDEIAGRRDVGAADVVASSAGIHPAASAFAWGAARMVESWPLPYEDATKPDKPAPVAGG